MKGNFCKLTCVPVRQLSYVAINTGGQFCKIFFFLFGKKIFDCLSPNCSLAICSYIIVVHLLL